MIKNILLVTLRNIRKQKLFSFINILGLAVGIAAFLLLFLYVKHEMSFDTCHVNADRLYRVTTDISMQNGQLMASAFTPGQLAKGLSNTFPEVEAAVRVYPGPGARVFVDEKLFTENNFWFADTSIFSVFTFEFVYGNADNAISTASSVVITEEIAEKYFGNDNPIGKVIRLNNQKEYQVTAVIKSLDGASHISFDFIAYGKNEPVFNRSFWGSLSLYTYVLLDKNANAGNLVEKFPAFVKDNIGENWIDLMKFDLEPVRSIHLYSEREHDVAFKTSYQQVYLLAGISILIILVACINFMNLSTARSLKRAKEIGIRKVVGAERKTIVFQFLGEAMALVLISMSISLGLVYLLLDSFNTIILRELEFSLIENAPYLIIILFVTGIIAGLYPALFLSSFRPVVVLKGRLNKVNTRIDVKKILVVLQFTITSTIILSTIIVMNQMDFIKNKSLGYNKDLILTITLQGDEVSRNYSTIVDMVKEHPNVKDAAASYYYIGQTATQNSYFPQEFNDESILLKTLYADYGFLELYEIEMFEGRTFSESHGTDKETGCIINEAAMKRLGWQSGEGKTIEWLKNGPGGDTSRVQGRVIGVVKDFHFESLYNNIEPVIFRMPKDKLYNLSIKLNSNVFTETITWLENKWAEINPYYPFQYRFQDELIERLYRAEHRLITAFSYFSVITIIISCLGLFALVAFTTEQRTKEIGIRKVMGASISRIVVMLSREFCVIIILAVIISSPISYYLMDKYLQSFAYRVSTGLGTYLLAGVIIFVISIATMSFVTVKAAKTNPAISIRNE